MKKPYLDISKDSLGRIMIHYEGRRMGSEQLSAQLAISVRIADWVKCGYCGNKVDILESSGRQEEHTYRPLSTRLPTRCPWSDSLPAPVLGGA